MDKQFKNRQLATWCKRLIRISLFSLYAVIAFDTNSSIAAPKGKLQNWQFSPQGSQLEISLSAPSRPQYFYLSDPPRIVVDLPDTELGYVPTQQNYNGAIQRIRVSQLNDDVTRIVMDLAPGAFFNRNQVQLQPSSWQNPTRWVFRPLIAGNTNFSAPGYSSMGGDLPPGAYSPSQPPGIIPPQPPGAYLPSQPPGILPPSQPPGAYSPSQPPGILPPSQPLGAYLPSQPPGILPPSQLPPGVNASPTFTTPLTLPPVNIDNRNDNTNVQQPTVSVPAITNSNLPPQIQNSVLPPASFPSPSGSLNSSPPSFPAAPYTLPTMNTPEAGVVEFGQPFPNPTR